MAWAPNRPLLRAGHASHWSYTSSQQHPSEGLAISCGPRGADCPWLLKVQTSWGHSGLRPIVRGRYVTDDSCPFRNSPPASLEGCSSSSPFTAGLYPCRKCSLMTQGVLPLTGALLAATSICLAPRSLHSSWIRQKVRATEARVP
jgi:hypothetical protein